MNAKDFADQIVTQLNAEPDKFISFTAVRAYNPRVLLEKVTALKVLVVPKAFKTNRNDETAWEEFTAVDIGVVKKLSLRAIVTGLEDNVEIDPLMTQVEQIVNYFQSEEYEAPEGFDLYELANDPIFDPEQLRENRQFTSIITLTFHGICQEVWE